MASGTIERDLFENFTRDPRFSDKQKEFLTDKAPFPAFVGGFGAGKTVCLVARAMLISVAHPGNVGFIGRKNMPALKRTTMKEFFQYLPKWATPRKLGGTSDTAKWNGSEFKFTFPTEMGASEIYFGDLENFEKHKSLTLGWFAIDEGSEVSEEAFLLLMSRLRLNRVPKECRQGFVVSNPEGHNWMWKRWVKEAHSDYSLTHARVYDNPFLDREYIRRMEDSLPPEMRKRYLDGDFNVVGGLVYPEFSRGLHVVNGEIPDDWLRGRMIDHGVNNPTVCLWYAVSPNGVIYIYREYYESHRTIRENVHHILAMSLDETFTYPDWIDPAAKQRNAQTGSPELQAYHDHGLLVAPAPSNDKKVGFDMVRQLLKRQDNLTHPFNETPGCPRLLVDRYCSNTIREFESYKWRQLRPGTERNNPDMPEKKDDHAMDCIRYMALARVETWQSGYESSTTPWWKIRKEKTQELDPHLGSEW